MWGRGQAHNRQPDEGAPQQQPPPQVSVPISAVGGGSPPAASNPGDQLLSNTPHNFPNMHSEPLASMQARPFPWAKSLLSVCLNMPCTSWAARAETSTSWSLERQARGSFVLNIVWMQGDQDARSPEIQAISGDEALPTRSNRRRG